MDLNVWKLLCSKTVQFAPDLVETVSLPRYKRHGVAAVKPKAKKARDQARDPRFSDSSGKLDVNAFSKAYKFLDGSAQRR